MSILDWLLPSGMATPLSATELFYLLAAALLHDIGMLGAADQSGDDQAQERIRDSHHLRSAEYVLAKYERLGLSRPEATAIGEICRAHRKVNIVDDVVDVPDSGSLVRIRLLAAAVRLADELHLTPDRAPQIVLDAIRPPQDSVSHFERHLGIVGVGPSDFSQGVIQISAIAETLAQERVQRKMADEIQEKLSEVAPLFAQHGLPWTTVNLSLQRRRVVERKIVLHLAQVGQAERDGLREILREPSGIESSLQDLEQSHFIEPGETSEFVRLTSSTTTAHRVQGRFGQLLGLVNFRKMRRSVGAEPKFGRAV